MSSRVERIEQQLRDALDVEVLQVFDDSQAHAGHAGVRESGGGHFSAIIVSPRFEGQGLVARHKLVYAALGDLMRTDIHAFSMKVLTPAEYRANRT